MPQARFFVRPFFILALFCTCAIVTVRAHAQTVPAKGRRIAVSVGGLSVSDGDTRQFSDRNHAVVGVSYDAGKIGQARQFVYGPYLDYLFQASQTVNTGPFNSVDPGSGTTFSFTVREQGRAQGGGLGVAGRFLLTNATKPRSVVPYFGGGLGVYLMQAKYSVSAVDVTQSGGYSLGNYNDVQATSDRTVGLGGKISAGLQTGAGIFGEVEYQFLPKFRLEDANSGNYLQVNLSGFGARLGYRF